MAEQKVNLNTATVEELTQLSGIGSALAERIIDYRETVHPFEEIDEVTAVSGISERMYQAVADRVTVGAPSEPFEPIAEGAEEPTGGEAEVLPEEPSQEPSPEDEMEAPEEVEEGPPSSEEAEPEEVVVEAEAAPEEEPAQEPQLPAPPHSRSWWGRLSWLWAALLGGVLGMIFTLLVLSGINGSLDISHSPAVLDIKGQLDGLAAEIDTLKGEASGLRQRLDTLEGLTARMNEVESEVSDLSEETGELAQQAEALDEELSTFSEDLAALEERAQQVQGFFQRLQALLKDTFGEVQTTPVPTRTPWVTPTPSMTPTPAQ